jgi:hypothetical protein
MSIRSADSDTYPRFSTQLQAKKFFIDKIILQAQQEGIALSDEENICLLLLRPQAALNSTKL